MSNQSSSKEGKQQTDEKVALVPEESQLEPALPPFPPPSNPSSSSSLLPSSYKDPSHTNVASSSSSSSGDPVAAQFAQLFSIVGRLSSENEALKAQGDVHSSTIARLSSENEKLRRRDEERERTMEEMSKAFGSHWVWEAGRKDGEGRKGRWIWSGEKYRRASLQVTRSKPPPSLDSIPVELITSIFSLLDRPDHLALCGVSFRLLQVASAPVYGKPLVVGSEKAAMFVAARARNLNRSSNRITTLLLPSALNLLSVDFDASHFTPLSVTNADPFAIQHVAIGFTSSSSLLQWYPILRLLDPLTLQFSGPRGTAGLIPTAFELDDTLFLDSWTRLKAFRAAGALSVPVDSGNDGGLALSECLHRCHPGGRMRSSLVSASSDGRELTREEFETKEWCASFLQTQTEVSFFCKLRWMGLMWWPRRSSSVRRSRSRRVVAL